MAGLTSFWSHQYGTAEFLQMRFFDSEDFSGLTACASKWLHSCILYMITKQSRSARYEENSDTELFFNVCQSAGLEL
jgi:hypothetical protein